MCEVGLPRSLKEHQVLPDHDLGLAKNANFGCKTRTELYS